VPNVAWSSRVDESLLKATDKKEIARQEIINEIIYSEEKFLSDLTVLKEVIVDGLNGSNAIEKTRRQEFLQIVFNNYEELIVISRDLFKDLLDLHYRYDRQCVPMIGDILVQHIAFFEKPFVTYSPHAPLAKYIAETEIKNNPEFERFVKDIANHSRTNRLPFWNYLLCPVTRMQRYPLLISTLLKKTPEEHPDYTYLTRCYDMIRQVAKKADNATAPVKRQLGILAVRDAITFKQGELIDLQLGDMTRTLYHRGILRRRNTTEAADKHDIYVFVFDHMVVMTKMRKTSTGEEYRLWRRPIPLHLLTIQNSSTGIKPQLSGTATNYAFPGGSATIALQHLGQKDGLFPFYCSSLEEKQVWVKAIEDAKTSLRKRLGDSDVFELRPLDDINFRYFGPSTTSARIHCSVPFTTSQGERKIAIGTDNGVFLKTENQDSSVRRIIQTETVIQLAVMEKHHILIVLTGSLYVIDKHLYIYSF
jgi:hypothetical protein